MVPVRLGVGVLAVILSASTAWANPLDVSLGGVWAFRITHGAFGLTAEQRVVQVTRRLTEVLSIPRLRCRGAAVRVIAEGADVAIVVDHVLVVTVTPDDAQGTGVPALELARQWAERLTEGLARALPPCYSSTHAPPI